MQRRRKPKAQPKDIFGKETKEPKRQIRASAPPTPKAVKAAPPPIAGTVKPQPPVPAKPTPPPPEEALVEPEIKEESEDVEVVVEEAPPAEEIIEEPALETDVLEAQMFGRKPRKGIGLSQLNKPEAHEPVKETGTSDKALELIQKSKERATESVDKVATRTDKDGGAKPKAASAPRPRRRGIKSSYQPAARAKRLDRSRHMEYKYEMRGILKDLNIAEEHRSGILGSIWAKGERQTAEDAKKYLEEKMQEGIIDAPQLEELTKVIDEYTIRR